jgi:hypothetical protein
MHIMTRLFRRHRPLLAALVAVPVIAVAACGGDSATGPNANPAGSYHLSTVAGKSVPATMFSDTAFSDVITAGSLALQADGKYVIAVTLNETVAGHLSVYVDSGSGTWSQSGANALTMVSAEGASASVPWTGTTVTVVDTDSVTWVFSR